MGRSAKKKTKNTLREVHARLFDDDVETLIKIAEERRTKWQMELRLLVHRALKGERREFVTIKENT